MMKYENNIVGLPAKNVDDFEKEISAAFQKIRENIILTALLCAEANHDLSRNDLKILKPKLGFDSSKFSKFLQIAKKPWISGQKYRSHLPSSFTTLYELTQLSEKEFKAAIIASSIRTGMEKKDAEALRQGNRKSSQNNPKPAIILTARLAKENPSKSEILVLNDLIHDLYQNGLVTVDIGPAGKKIMRTKT